MSKSFRDLLAYKKAFELALDIHKISLKFPKEETYSLTDQIRRSSRSVCANIGEAYRKRRYPKHFISKLTDSDAENTETQVWLDFALSLKYIDKEQYDLFIEKSEEIGKLINFMINNPDKFS
ncbi:MAG: four helix bundle protein [Salinivirgaceae bacterium]|nr:four helix bundle protein [Salinivirgaceae bacterium]